MAVPPPQINNFVNKKQNSKYFRIYYYILEVFVFLDFGFLEFKSYKLNILRKTFTVIKLIVMCILFLTFGYEFYFLYHHLISFAFTVLYLLFIKPDKTFFKLLCDLETIHRQLKINTEYHHHNVKLYLAAFSFLKLCLRIMFTSYFSFVFHFHSPRDLSYMWSTVGIDLALLNYSFGFYLINGILKSILCILRVTTNNSDFLSLQMSYKLVVEIADKFKAGSDLMYLVELVTRLPETIYHITITVNGFLDRSSIIPYDKTVGFAVVVAADGIISLLIPSIVAEMNLIEVDKIKILLHNKLMLIDDPIKQRDILRFIEYVKFRGLRFRVYNLVPQDARLLLMLFSFCITYIIIIIQFLRK